MDEFRATYSAEVSRYYGGEESGDNGENGDISMIYARDHVEFIHAAVSLWEERDRHARGRAGPIFIHAIEATAPTCQRSKYLLNCFPASDRGRSRALWPGAAAASSTATLSMSLARSSCSAILLFRRHLDHNTPEGIPEGSPEDIPAFKNQLLTLLRN